MKNNSTQKDLKKKLIKPVLTGVLIYVLFFVLDAAIKLRFISKYDTRILMAVGISIILAVSLNLIIGFTGQLTLGHAAFMSIGAYASAMVTMKLNFPFALSLLFGALFAALLAALIGFPILRLKGDYLAICTLGFGEIVKVVIQNVDALGGAKGLSGIPDKTKFFWVFFSVVVTIIVIKNIINSTQGRAMISLREDDIAAESMGINTTKYKLMSFIIAAFFAGLAGGLYAHYYGFIDPASFNFTKSIEILTFVVFGGMGSLSGSVLATGVITYLLEILREVKDYRMIIYAALLVVLMIFRPQGLMGTKELSLSIFKGKSKKKDGDTNVTA